MRKLIISLKIALLLIFSISSINAQYKKPKTDLFNLDVLNFYSSEGTRSRVDIYIEIPLKNIEFKKSKTLKNTFVSSFDLNIDVKDASGNIIYNNVSKDEVTTQEIGQEFLMHNSQILTRNIFLPPGNFEIIVSMLENSTKKRTEQSRKITVNDFYSPPLSISNVMVVSKLTSTDGRKVITPDVSRNISDVDTFYLFYYIYNNNPGEVIAINCLIKDADNKEVFNINETLDQTSVYTFQNQIFMAFPTNNLSFGNYSVEITAASNSSNAAAQSYFQNISYDFPLPLNQIDVLIDQLQYIAKSDEISYIKKGKTLAEKQKRFLEFWKKKDPSPNTKRNETMQEYYKRIAEADKRFSTVYTPGWKTDMGMVFIIFGEPNNIDRHPYDMDQKPYEIWQYYQDNKEFIFVDNTGFGDYRLITPIWDTFRYQR